MSTQSIDTARGPKARRGVIPILALFLGAPWPGGPLLVAVVLYATVLRDRGARERAAIIWWGLGISAGCVVLIALLFATGAVSHLFFTTT